MTKNRQFISNSLKALILPVVVYLFFFITSRILGLARFGTASHMYSILQMTVQSAILAWGMMFNMYSSRWDFSGGTILMLAAIIGADIANTYALGAWGLLLFTVLVAVVLGCISGVVYLVMRVPSIVASIGMMMIYESMTALYKGGVGSSVRGDMTIFGTAPYNLIVMAAMFALTYILFNYTKLGYHIRALGGDQAIAVNTGVSSRKAAMISYLLLGLFVGVGGVVYISTSGAVRAVIDMSSTGIMFDSMMCILVGMALNKYCNPVVSTFIGCFSMKMLSAGLLTLGLNSTLQNVATGLFLFVFITITTNQGVLQRRRQLAERAQAANSRAAS